MKPSGGGMRLAALAAAPLACAATAADAPPVAPPDPGLLEFLGELAGKDADFILYTTPCADAAARRDGQSDLSGLPIARFARQAMGR